MYPFKVNVTTDADVYEQAGVENSGCPQVVYDGIGHGSFCGLNSFGTRVADDAGRQVYSRVLSGTGRRAVLLLNRTGSAATITARFADIGLGATASVRNVLTATDLGSKTTSYAVSVPANDSILLMVTE